MALASEKLLISLVSALNFEILSLQRISAIGRKAKYEQAENDTLL